MRLRGKCGILLKDWRKRNDKRRSKYHIYEEVDI